MSTSTPTTAAAATSTTLAARTYTGELTTVDGRYAVTVVVGPSSPTAAADACPAAGAATATTGKVFLPITVTVANAATDRSAPFPPMRVELAGAPGTRPAQVMVRDATLAGTGGCTSTPKFPFLAARASAVFKGTSPAIDIGAAAGSAGRVEVKVSENTFSLAAPVP